jgi:hypothetical protein
MKDEFIKHVKTQIADTRKRIATDQLGVEALERKLEALLTEEQSLEPLVMPPTFGSRSPMDTLRPLGAELSV